MSSIVAVLGQEADETRKVLRLSPLTMTMDPDTIKPSGAQSI